MKKKSFAVLVGILSALLLSFSAYSQEAETIPFQMVEQKPSFNGGGANEFSKWVNAHINYPVSAKTNGIQGRVTLSFIVDSNGKVKNVNVLRGLDSELDNEAVRVVSSSPSWTPGRQKGEPVNVSYMFPVVFSLQETVQVASSSDICTRMDDPEFKRYCLSNFDTNKDGKISIEEAATVKDIDVREMNIKSLKGIEFFTNLTQLRCGSNQLTSLDVSKNTALEVLHCGWNQLTGLDVSKNTALRVFSCNSNNLKNIDVSKNTVLTSLDCGNTQLSSLDVSRNTALTSLNCMANQLTSLDLSRNKQLKDLDCRWNQFTTLDVSNNAQLNELKFDGSVIGNAQQKNALPYWVFDYKWSYTSTVKGTRNVPASRDFKISFESGTENPFSITITNRSPLQADNWQRTWKGTYTYSNGKIILSYNSERTVLIIDYENKCLRFENGERLAKSYS